MQGAFAGRSAEGCTLLVLGHELVVVGNSEQSFSLGGRGWKNKLPVPSPVHGPQGRRGETKGDTALYVPSLPYGLYCRYSAKEPFTRSENMTLPWKNWRWQARPTPKAGQGWASWETRSRSLDIGWTGAVPAVVPFFSNTEAHNSTPNFSASGSASLSTIQPASSQDRAT